MFLVVYGPIFSCDFFVTAFVAAAVPFLETTRQTGAGPSPCKSKRSAPAPRSGSCGRSCWTRRAAAKSTVVLVWRLDRWGRSVADLVATLQELEHLGVGFVSLTEALDLTTPAGRAMSVDDGFVPDSLLSNAVLSRFRHACDSVVGQSVDPLFSSR